MSASIISANISPKARYSASISKSSGTVIICEKLPSGSSNIGNNKVSVINNMTSESEIFSNISLTASPSIVIWSTEPSPPIKPAPLRISNKAPAINPKLVNSSSKSISYNSVVVIGSVCPNCSAATSIATGINATIKFEWDKIANISLISSPVTSVISCEEEKSESINTAAASENTCNSNLIPTTFSP